MPCTSGERALPPPTPQAAVARTAECGCFKDEPNKNQVRPMQRFPMRPMRVARLCRQCS